MINRQRSSLFLDFPGGIVVERDVPCRMRDGVVLRSDIYRPASSGKLPALLMRLPYDKRIAETTAGFAHPSWYASRGYVVVVQDVRGRFASEGEFYPFRYEAADGAVTVEWVSELPYCDGRVAMYGSSYMGVAQLLTASCNPRGLVTVCPSFTASSVYSDWVYPGGALALGFVSAWVASQVGAGFLSPEQDDISNGTLTTQLDRLAEQVSFLRDWLAHPVPDEYWASWDIATNYPRFDIPALHIAGWYDIFLRGTVRNFNGLAQRGGAVQKLVIGPWMHTPLTPLDPTAGTHAGANLINDWHLDWMDYIFYGRELGTDTLPVTAFIGGLGWCEYSEWPPPGRQIVELYLHSSGRAQSKFGDGTLTADPPGKEHPDIVISDPSALVPSRGGHSCCSSDVMGPADQEIRESSRSVLVYTTEPLQEPLSLIGNALLILYAVSDVPVADYMARLCVVDEKGVSINLQEGMARAGSEISPIETSIGRSAEVSELRIDLGPIGQRIPAGHRIRLQVSGSDYPLWGRLRTFDSVPVTGLPPVGRPLTQLIFHDGTYPARLVLETGD